MPSQLKSPRVRTLSVEYLATTALMPDPRNARKHPQRQIARLKAIIEEFGFTNPILTDEKLSVIAGHARLDSRATSAGSSTANGTDKSSRRQS